ncbi:helix-turn-helix domain-containing protein [Nocardiopsis sp. RSe5-2]|uniref:Helix-turn-helix domain-containing protein n=1 Tax=Nocardiopsis endophytica TaxID=3018445 RepID=A0ABT4TWY8_9ACTN|nr:helix-turn-helix domain-containing protein [Nocardiopsis endophytica]MDA2809199.1 helix-turn-helix domain-containing protein [Nocardiopsis endophytica]
MDALVVRLSQLDTEAAGALRLVAFYDTLMRRRVDLPALARASAGVAECVAGAQLHGTGSVVRFAPNGREAPDPVPAARSTVCPVILDEEEVGTVWLEREDAPRALDELLLDRFALAAAAALERHGPARTTMADPALVELVISHGGDEAARARALRLLGFAADVPVRVAAVRTREPLDRVGAQVCSGRPVKAATVGGVGVLLAGAVDAARFPEGARAGIGAADGPAESWRQARTALRFTTPLRPVVHHRDLGVLALLAEVPPDAARAAPDVAAIGRLAAAPEDLETLEVYCAVGSVRRTAERLHLHHSSVARRIERIGGDLGVDLTDPAGSTRAGMALALWRLLDG